MALGQDDGREQSHVTPPDMFFAHPRPLYARQSNAQNDWEKNEKIPIWTSPIGMLQVMGLG